MMFTMNGQNYQIVVGELGGVYLTTWYDDGSRHRTPVWRVIRKVA